MHCRLQPFRQRDDTRLFEPLAKIIRLVVEEADLHLENRGSMPLINHRRRKTAMLALLCFEMPRNLAIERSTLTTNRMFLAMNSV